MKQSSNKTESKQNCSLLSVILVLAIILIFLLSGIVYVRIKKGFIGLKKTNSQTETLGLEENFKKQLDNQKGEDVVVLSVSENDLKELLNLKDKNFPLKNPDVSIDTDKILLTGKTSDSVFSFKLSISIIPRAENGKVLFDIKEIKTGGVNAPKVVVDQVSGGLKDYLSQLSPFENEVDIEKLSLSTGYLTVTGKKKL